MKSILFLFNAQSVSPYKLEFEYSVTQFVLIENSI